MNKPELLNKIEGYIKEKDFAKARKLIQNDLKRLGTKYEYYFYLGVASDIPEERLNNFKKAIQIEPNNIEVIINYSNALDEVGEHKLAIEGYNKALEIDSKLPLVYNNRGYSSFQLKEYKLAMQDYNRALIIAPKLAIAEQNRQKLLEILNQDAKYQDIITIAENLCKEPQYYLSLGIKEMNSNEKVKAELAFKKAIELKSDFKEAYLFLGVLEFNQENYNKAYDYYSKCIEIDKKMVDAYFNRAQIIFATKTEDEKELRKAIEDYKKAVELDDHFIDAYYSMAVAYKKLEEYQHCIQSLDKILLIDNESVNAKALKKLILTKYLKLS